MQGVHCLLLLCSTSYSFKLIGKIPLIVKQINVQLTVYINKLAFFLGVDKLLITDSIVQLRSQLTMVKQVNTF